MRKSVHVALLAAGFALSGCGGWSRPNTTEAQFYEDRLQCEQQANNMYPPAMSAIGQGYQAPARTNCTAFGNQMNCTTTPGAYTPPAQLDVNSIARANAFSGCMKSKSYVFGR